MNRETPTVVYLDHSVAPGGAQLALARVLSVTSTVRLLIVPGRENPAWGVFSDVSSTTKHLLRKIGPEQRSGATTEKGLIGAIGFALRIVAQSGALRASPLFRAATIVHANSARAALYGALACFASRKILVVHLRDMSDEVSLGKIGFLSFTNLALRRADAVVANSHATLASAVPYLRPKALRRVIPSPIGLTAPSSAPKVSPVIARIGMVARIDTWKGQDVAIKAFAQEFKGQQTQLLFAGDALFGKESIRSDLEALASSLGVDSQVHFLGHVSDVAGFISSLDVCLQASTRPEPLGQNVLQYLKLGKVTIATNEGGPAEWIKDRENGLLVALGDVQGLAEALAQLTNDYALRVRLSKGAFATHGILSDAEVRDLQDALYRDLSWC